jgi:hypothetical protein
MYSTLERTSLACRLALSATYFYLMRNQWSTVNHEARFKVSSRSTSEMLFVETLFKRYGV